jgi:hypothetical protein
MAEYFWRSWRRRSSSSRRAFLVGFAVECEACGGELRPNQQFGVPIRCER